MSKLQNFDPIDMIDKDALKIVNKSGKFDSNCWLGVAIILGIVVVLILWLI